MKQLSRLSEPLFGLGNRSGLAPNSEVARLFLAFLTTAGLFYVNIMPALIEGLVDGLGFSNRDAGFVASANVYGAALGAFVVVFLIPYINWRIASYGLLVGLVVVDLISMWLELPTTLIAVRFAHGFIGGLLVGIGFSVIARTANPDRTFGYLLTVQFGLGGAGLVYIPGLVSEWGTTVVFGSLIVFSVMTLLMVPFLDRYLVESRARRTIPWHKMNRFFVLALIGTFLFQAANMAVYAYIFGLGREAGLDTDYMSLAVGEAAWIAILGSVLVIIVSTRFGRVIPIGLGILLTVLGTYAFLYSDTKYVYWLANVAVGITWAFVISYLLGLCSEFDETGQLAAVGGLASKLGLASGPMLAALLVDDLGYSSMVWMAIIALVLCFFVTILPSRERDRIEAQEG